MASLVVVTGCTRYASEEQLKQLEETKSAALSAEKKVEDLNTEKANLQKELEAKKKELEAVKEERETVKKRLKEF